MKQTKETREEKKIRRLDEKAELREERKSLARWDRNMKRLKKIGAVAMIAFLISFHLSADAQDTIYVKKVKVNNISERIKCGYIIRKSDSLFIVNDKEMKLYMYKPTERRNFKPHRKQ